MQCLAKTRIEDSVTGMDWWLIGLLMSGAALIAVRLWVGPAPDNDAWLEDETDHPLTDLGEAGPLDPREPELWEVEALARWGTETTVEQLIIEGRTDELRGLGYAGDLPDS